MAANDRILHQLNLAQFGNARQIARAFAAYADKESVSAWLKDKGWTSSELQTKAPASAVRDLANHVANEAMDTMTIDLVRSKLKEMTPDKGESPEGEGRPGQGDGEPAPHPAPNPKRGEGEGEGGQPQPGEGEGEGEGDDVDAALDAVRNAIENAKAQGQPLSEEEKEKLKEDLKQELKDEGFDGVTKEIVVKTPEGEIKAEGLFHYKTPLVIAAVNAARKNSIGAEINILLVGEAGSGKTRMARCVAEALELPNWCVFSCNPFTTKGDVVGIYDVNGKFNLSVIMKAVTEPGLVFFDELDRCHPGAAIALQSLLANRFCFLPDGQRIDAHEDCVMLAGANTWGTGANDRYSAANRMDAATMDRFFGITIDYDQGLEAAICGVEGVPSPTLKLDSGGEVKDANEWLKLVWSAREAAHKEKINTVISPRSSQMGVALAEQGIGKDWLLRGLVYKGLKEDQQVRISETGKFPLSNVE